MKYNNLRLHLRERFSLEDKCLQGQRLDLQYTGAGIETERVALA